MLKDKRKMGKTANGRGGESSFVIEQESGARSLQLRFMAYVLLLVFFGLLIPHPSPFYEIRDASSLFSDYEP
jgi:hypothetical protein